MYNAKGYQFRDANNFYSNTFFDSWLCSVFVKQAVKDFGIKYPVIQDNNYGTWNAYGNRYWPRDYLVDSEGYIRYDHVGEGGYNETKSMIQSLLAEPETNPKVNQTLAN